MSPNEAGGSASGALRSPEPSAKGVVDAIGAARLLGAHVETVRRLARRGQIPGYKVGKDWRFDANALRDWVSSQVRDRGVNEQESPSQDRSQPGPEVGALLESLRQSEVRLRNIQAIARIGSFELEIPNGRLSASEEFQRIYGVDSTSRVTYGEMPDFVHPADKDFVETSWNAALQGAPFDIEHRIVVGDDVKWVRAKTDVQYDLEGAAIGASGTVQDITDRKLVEIELAEGAARFRQLAERATVGIYVIQDGLMAYVNHSFANTFGYEVDEIVGMLTPHDLLHPDRHDDVTKNLSERLEGIEPTESITYKGVRKDRSEIYVEAMGQRIDYQGRPAVLGSLLDITERKQMELELAESEEKFRQLSENAVVGICVIQDEKAVYVNQSFAQTFGYDVDEIVGKMTPRDLICEEDVDSVLERLYDRLGGLDNNGSSIYRGVRKDGSLIYIEVFSQLIEFQGRLAVQGTLIDVTDREQNQARYQAIFETANAAIVVSTLEGKIVTMNEAFLEMSGYTRKELRGHDANTFYADPSDRERMLNAVRRNGEVRNLELKLITKSGETKWISLSARPTTGWHEDCLLSVGFDITDRKRTDAALRKTEDHLQFAMSQLPGTLWAIDRELTFTVSTGAGLSSMGLHAGEVVGLSLMEFFGTNDQQFMPIAMHRRALTGEPVSYEFHHENIIFDTTLEPLKDENGDVCGVIGIAYDVTNNRLLERELRKSEERFRSLSESSPIGVFQTDANGSVLYTNPRWQAITGMEQEESLGFGWSKALHPDDTDRVLAEWEDCLRAEKGYAGEFRFLSSSGEVKWVYTWTTPMRSPNGKVIGHVGANQDITDWKHTEEALIQSEHRLNTLNLLAQIFLTVPDDEMYEEVLETVLEVTGSRHGIFGYIDEDGALICPSLNEDVLSERDVAAKTVRFTREEWGGMWGDALTSRKALYSNSPGNVPHGHVPISRSMVVPILHRGELIGILSVANKTVDYSAGDLQWLEDIAGWVAPVLDARLQRDRTERSRAVAEARLHQAQKMEAIGHLAGGIAHDFNNILGAMIGYCELLREKIGSDKVAALDYVERIKKGGERAGDLIAQILTFSRQSDIRQQPIRLGPVVEEALELLRGALPSSVELHEDISAEADEVLADEAQMHQVVMNLCTNAVQSMHNGKGILNVSLQPVSLEVEDALGYEDISPGNYLRLSITDTGHGMPPEVVERAFDPFFTTKEPGEGTGMGLAVVNNVVANHGGAVTVTSEVGRGTTIDVMIPRIDHYAATGIGESTSNLPGGTERILVVDDEAELVKVLSTMLASLGYSVVSCESALAAHHTFATSPDAFDVLITDLTMPQMTGIELTHLIHEIRPDIPVLVCTGYGRGLTLRTAHEAGVRDILRKPLNKQMLAAAVREALDECAANVATR